MIDYKAMYEGLSQFIGSDFQFGQEGNPGQVKNVSPLLGYRLSAAFCAGVMKTLKARIESDSKEPLRLPIGDFTATAKGPSIGFVASEMLVNQIDSDTDLSVSAYNQHLDPIFFNEFQKFAAKGTLAEVTEPADGEEKISLAIGRPETKFYLNAMCEYFAKVVQDHEKTDKIVSITVGDSITPHGTYRFERQGDAIKVTFVADKGLKEFLKNDNKA